MAATGIINGARTDQNAPQSTGQASTADITYPAQPSAPLGSPTAASTITPSPSTSGAANAAPSAANYYNQLNDAANQKSMQAPSEANAPTPTPAPSAYSPLPAPYTQPDTSPAPSPTPTGIIRSSMKSQAPVSTTSTNQLVGTAATQPAGETDAQQNALNFAVNAYNANDGMGLMKGSTGSGTGTDTLYAPGTPTGSNNPAYITASLQGKSTDGIPYTIGGSVATPSSVAPQTAQTSANTTSPIVKSAMKSQAPASASTPATAADISADFAADFGRPAAATGLQYYTDYLNAHPGMTEADLNQMIIGGAQSQDKAANASLNGGGAVSTNWNNPNLQPENVQSSTTNPNGQDVWNAATNSWTTAPTANGTLTSAQTYNPSLLGTPTQVNVGTQQTVAGELQNLENENSPLIQAAEAQAKQQANASGLLNSTMAITAGRTAAYNAALPVATADATTYNNDAVTNANQANTFAVDNQTAQNAAGQFNATQQNNLTSQKMTQAMTAASTAQQAGSTYSNWLAQIQNSTMDASAKNAAEVQAYNTYYQQMQALAKAGLPDVSGLLSFNGVDPNTGLPDTRDPNTGLYSSSGSTATNTNATPTAGNGTTPPTGAAVGSTYTSGDFVYTVGANGQGFITGKIG